LATLKEIAERAGVSVRTVSRALSGAADIQTVTRQRIEKLAQELDYRPNPIARGLRLQRGFAVPVIVHQPDELCFAKVCVMERELRAAKLVTQLIFNPGGADEEAGLLAEAIASRPAAVVLFSSAHENSATHLDRLHRSGLPYVLIDSTPLPQLDTIRIDRAAGVARAVGQLLDGGHRYVCCLGPASGGRAEGFLRAFTDRSIPPPEGWGLHGYEASYDSARKAAADLLRLHPAATGAFAYSDLFAWGVLRGLTDAGVGVPGRLSLIGFDDRPPSRYVTPPLSTVAHPHEDVGRLAAEVILGKIAGQLRPGEGSRLAVPRYIERASTRSLA
jgi:DNA-binding LacI/PurR family transcriptional regulator